MATAFKQQASRFDLLQMSVIDAPGMYRSGFYLVTPTIANFILENRHPLNRFISRVKSVQVEGDMSGDKFVINGESLIFSTEGNLIDGQHRLMACVGTETPFTSLCAFGIPPEARSSIDLGKARTSGDMLTMLGVADANHVAAAVRIVLSFSRAAPNGPLPNTGVFSTADVLGYAESNPNVIHACQWARCFKMGLAGITTPSVMAAARLILEPRYGEGVLGYLDQVGSGENIASGDPAFAVRRRLTGFRSANPVALEAILRGAIAYMEGRRLARAEVHGRMPALPKPIA